jgi:membrane-associated phospholipid phosphatase
VNTAARVISFVFHPLLMATYLFGLFALAFPIAFDPIKEDGTNRFIFLLFCVTFILPVLMLSLLKTLGFLHTFTMHERQERIVPFIMITVFYTAVTYVFYDRAEVSLNDNFLKFLIVINGLVVVSTVVTLFYKVSVHSLGIWGLIGILVPLNKISDAGTLFLPTIAAIIVAGVIMSARLQLNVHKLTEVFSGAFIGFCTSFVIMHFLFHY